MLMWSSEGRAWKAASHVACLLDLAGMASRHGSYPPSLTYLISIFARAKAWDIAGDSYAMVPEGRCSQCGSARLGMLCRGTASRMGNLPIFCSSFFPQKCFQKKKPLCYKEFPRVRKMTKYITQKIISFSLIFTAKTQQAGIFFEPGTRRYIYAGDRNGTKAIIAPVCPGRAYDS